MIKQDIHLTGFQVLLVFSSVLVDETQNGCGEPLYIRVVSDDSYQCWVLSQEGFVISDPISQMGAQNMEGSLEGAWRGDPQLGGCGGPRQPDSDFQG